MNIAVNALSKWTSEAPYLGHCPVLRKIGQAEHLIPWPLFHSPQKQSWWWSRTRPWASWRSSGRGLSLTDCACASKLCILQHAQVRPEKSNEKLVQKFFTLIQRSSQNLKNPKHSFTFADELQFLPPPLPLPCCTVFRNVQLSLIGWNS